MGKEKIDRLRNSNRDFSSPVLHLERARRQRDDADALTLARQEAALQRLDQRLRRLLVQVLVVRGHRRQHRKYLGNGDKSISIAFRELSIRKQT